ncbi:bifunctional 5,10-methylenetetrahydrofolate dehydrogenase/5,10-methenyltetrahydrofolate cyclohydrolase [Sutcliffiella horikoshii]|uniref:bifunctional 5,10-methylenetetrahydrofolate dehydrogenase/5,10-methenyltetrahydrofolate cyclohydrolase n=1 Tax=Sutcliffiella horikoshii TaxID=79883 RepID=UPI001CBE2BE9|nr:bifunctional 5,10-methylenetetrahydrofolate dehydrogenase/5,10-methenyltetrahydrofolate cyclohydrolase [Sutcliffiella horikoshii]UAL47153.1 bifunctional 5,10-methylenetetrahydrofolate dehydrogenase/5,10-methenyltetrahydrofolate cyclohydrolase [Sutcliffiella horikoshii]
MLLLGRPIVLILEKNIKEELARTKVVPKLATILVGNNPSSETYVRMKVKACARVGIDSISYHLNTETTQEELLELIRKLNHDQEVDGILLQHPIPSHLDERDAFNKIHIDKDVDGVTTTGFGNMALGMDANPSCTPAAIMKLLKHYKIQVEGKHAVVIGRSPILGKPMASLLLNANATVTICHSYTEGLEQIVSTADIVIAAVGKPNFVKGSWIKEGAVVIDAGYNGGNVGDVDFESCLEKASAITPVPGGVGPITIATLLYQTVLSASKRKKENSN